MHCNSTILASTMSSKAYQASGRPVSSLASDKERTGVCLAIQRDQCTVWSNFPIVGERGEQQGVLGFM